MSLYARSCCERLNASDVIPIPVGCRSMGQIYVGEPSAVMYTVEDHTRRLGHLEHMLDFESFKADAAARRGGLYEIEVYNFNCCWNDQAEVPSKKTPLWVLREVDIDVRTSYESNDCGACKVKIHSVEVQHYGNSSKTDEVEKTCSARSIEDLRRFIFADLTCPAGC